MKREKKMRRISELELRQVEKQEENETSCRTKH